MTWPTARIGALCTRARKTDPRLSPDSSFRYIDISGIDREQKCIASTAELLGSDAPSRARQVVEANDVVVSTVRPNLNAVAMVPSELGGEIASTGFCVLRAMESVLHPRLLFFFVRTKQFINTLLQHVRGANYPAVTDKNVYDVEIPWLPRSEQDRIVEILDQAEALRKKRTEADTKAARILPALFCKMFGDLATNPNGWDTERFDSLVEIGTRLVDPNCPEYENLPHVGGEHIEKDTGRILSPQLVRDSALKSSKFWFSPNHILYSKIRPYLNKVSFPGFEGVCSADIYPLEPKDERISRWYLIALLRSPAFLAYAKVHSGRLRIPKLNKNQLGSFDTPIPAPSTLATFNEQAEQLVGIEESRFRSCEKINRLFDVLLYRAFNGSLTAKWREAQMEELLQEMEQQTKTLEANPPKSGGSKKSDKRHGGHDMYNKAALAAYITDRCHADDRPLGRVKLAKLFYLVQRKAELSLTEKFAQRAAGPLDDAIHKFLSLARKQKWMVLGRAQGGLKPVRPGADVAKGVAQAEKTLGAAKDQIDAMLEKMKDWGWQALERWATVLHAAEAILAEDGDLSIASIKTEIDKHPEWQAKLDRTEFSDEKLGSTLEGLRECGLLTPMSAGDS